MLQHFFEAANGKGFRHWHRAIFALIAAVFWILSAMSASPSGQEGWQLFLTSWYGVDCVDPTCRIIRANGDKAFFGWPDIPQVEAEVAAWYEATTLDEEKPIARRLNETALDNAIYAPLGAQLARHAWPSNVTGIAQGPLPFFWTVSKTV